MLAHGNPATGHPAHHIDDGFLHRVADAVIDQPVFLALVVLGLAMFLMLAFLAGRQVGRPARRPVD
jgi:hypothetical protein